VSINGVAVKIEADGNGQAENEDGSQTTARRFIETLPGGRQHVFFKLSSRNPLDTMPETVIPEGHVFVMGDNRDNSADSRVPLAAGGVGMLPISNLIGRVDGIVASWDLGMKSQPVWTWPKGLRLSRFFSGVI
jgi:signal peptidase I